jgi:hypothetical protein
MMCGRLMQREAGALQAQQQSRAMKPAGYNGCNELHSLHNKQSMLHSLQDSVLLPLSPPVNPALLAVHKR